MRTSWVALAFALASVFFAAGPGAAKPPPCPGGRYLVAGGPLMPGLDAAPDVVDLAGRTVSVLSGCGPVKAKVRATARGTKIRAHWKSCPAIVGTARLVGIIGEQCGSLAATFTAKTAGISRPIVASLSVCGDGVWDPGAGEACDAGVGTCGALCDACTCAGATTTTTSPAGATTSSTTAGGATTSSTTPALPTTSTTTTTLAGPDLAGIGWMSPSSAPSGSKIAVEFSVKNFGTATATAPWYDYIMISSDYAFGGDTAIAVVQRGSNLAASSQYTVLVPQVQLPAVSAGTYYLYLQTDGTNAVAETNEPNDIGGFVQITITP